MNARIRAICRPATALGFALSGVAPIEVADAAGATRALDTLVDTITTTVAAGDSVTLVGFGTFKPAQRAAREGKNPKTGEKISIPAATVPKFSAGASFETAVATAKTSKKK